MDSAVVGANNLKIEIIHCHHLAEFRHPAHFRQHQPPHGVTDTVIQLGLEPLELQVPFVLKDRIEELPAALLAAASRGPAGAPGVIPQPETTVPSR